MSDLCVTRRCDRLLLQYLGILFLELRLLYQVLFQPLLLAFVCILRQILELEASLFAGLLSYVGHGNVCETAGQVVRSTPSELLLYLVRARRFLLAEGEERTEVASGRFQLWRGCRVADLSSCVAGPRGAWRAPYSTSGFCYCSLQTRDGESERAREGTGAGDADADMRRTSILTRSLSTGRHSQFVRIVEVGPRDGLQNEPAIVPTPVKVELIDRLSKTGLRTIEATSFVSKKHIPQLSDATEVLVGLRSPTMAQEYLPSPISYPVLVPTEKYLHAALAAGAKEVAIFGSASEGFSKRNINCTIAESLERFRPMVKLAKEKGVRVRGYISCVIACPYDGSTPPERVTSLALEMLQLGCYEISLGDTIGVGTPGTVRTMLQEVLRHVPANKLAGHYHDTYGQGLANVLVSLDLGIRVFDSSVGGLGGCPFAHGATGNLATEDLVYMLHGSGYETGVDLFALSHVGDWISRSLGRQNQSRAGSALVRRHTKL